MLKLPSKLRGEIGAHLRLYHLPEPFRNALADALTYKNPDFESATRYSPWESTRVPETVTLALDFDDHLQIPRGFDPTKQLREPFRSRWSQIRWDDFRTEVPVTFPKLHLTPNADQKKILARFHAAIAANSRPFGTMLFVAPTSAGKCLGAGTLVMLANGNTVPVEKIKVGDELMGPDSLPRRVLSLARGRENLYRVEQHHGGDSYVVNESHILSLKYTGGAKLSNASSKGQVVNLSVADYLRKSKTFKHVTKGWRAAVRFERKGLLPELPPYLLGIWLGDGNSRAPSITTADKEVADYLSAYAKLHALKVRRSDKNNIGHNLSAGNRGRQNTWRNSLMKALRSLSLVQNKHIPFIYRTSSEQDRLELLAGLIDSDGHNNGHNFELTLKNKQLAHQVCFVARTLGFSSSAHPCEKCCTNSKTKAVGIYYRVYIGGDLDRIPCKVSRKKSSHRAVREPTTTAIKLVPLGPGDYYGFELDGDRLFLLGDCTVTHNTVAQGLLAAELGQRTLVLCKTNLIKKAWIEDMYKLYGMNTRDLGEIQQSSFRLGEHITLASIATLVRRKHLWPDLFSQIGCLIIDETQIIGADLIHEIVATCPAKYIIGMTATPTRRDGKTYIIDNYMGPPVLRILNKQTETENSFPLHDAEVVRTFFRFLDEEGAPLDREDLDLNQLLDAVAADKTRNDMIVERVKRDWKAGHCVLVSSPRVAHVQTLQKLLVKAGVKDASILMGSTNTDTYYTDKLIEDVLARRCRCLVATTQAIKLGANLNPLDRLHLCVPPGNAQDLEQLIGRIRRKHPGKTDTKLIYYHDIEVPYLHRKYKSIFFSVMRKLRVKRYEDVYVA